MKQGLTIAVVGIAAILLYMEYKKHHAHADCGCKKKAAETPAPAAPAAVVAHMENSEVAALPATRSDVAPAIQAAMGVAAQPTGVFKPGSGSIFAPAPNIWAGSGATQNQQIAYA